MNNLINKNQIVYISNRFISERGRLISDFVEITDLLQIEGILLMVETGDAFDCVSHFLLVSAFEQYCFKNHFVR